MRGVCVLVGDQECQRAIELRDRASWRCWCAWPRTLRWRRPARRPTRSDCSARGSSWPSRRRGRSAWPTIWPTRWWLADGTQVPKEEVFRVLRPGGQGAKRARDLGQAGPGRGRRLDAPLPQPGQQSAVARSRGPSPLPDAVHRRAALRPGAAVRGLVGGRVFMAFGHVAWHEREEPMLNTLLAVNGYNGTMLWKRPLTPGIMVDRSTMVATPETLYLADEKSCKVLDAATGGGDRRDRAAGRGRRRHVLEVDGPGRRRALRPGRPGGAAGPGRQVGKHAPRLAVGRDLQGLQRRRIPLGLRQDAPGHRPEDARRSSGATRKTPPSTAGRSRFTAGGSTSAHFGHYLACLEAKTGKPIWRRTAEKDPEVFQAIGPYRPGHGYIGGWKSTVYLKATDKALYFVGPQVEWLTALSADDGRVLWKHPAKDLHIVVRDDGLYTIGPQNSKDATKKLDPLTGKVLAEYTTSRRACTRSTGSADGIFFRAHEGSGRFDVAGRADAVDLGHAALVPRGRGRRQRPALLAPLGLRLQPADVRRDFAGAGAGISTSRPEATKRRAAGEGRPIGGGRGSSGSRPATGPPTAATTPTAGGSERRLPRTSAHWRGRHPPRRPSRADRAGGCRRVGLRRRARRHRPRAGRRQRPSAVDGLHRRRRALSADDRRRAGPGRARPTAGPTPSRRPRDGCSGGSARRRPSGGSRSTARWPPPGRSPAACWSRTAWPTSPPA